MLGGGSNLNINDDLTYEQLGIREDNDDYIYEDEDGFDELSENESITNQAIKVNEVGPERLDEKIETPLKTGNGDDSSKINTNPSIA